MADPLCLTGRCVGFWICSECLPATVHGALAVGPGRFDALCAQALTATRITKTAGVRLLGHGKGGALEFQYRVEREKAHLHLLVALTPVRCSVVPNLRDLGGFGRAAGQHRAEKADKKVVAEHGLSYS